MKKIVVTGHRGYIGSEIYFRLEAMGLRPVGIDLVERTDVRKHMPKSDVVIHCASSLGGENVFTTNVEMMKYVIESTKKVVFLSSAAVYGNNRNASEEDKLNPMDAYGESKVACETELINSGRESTIFRLSNVYSLYAIHGVVARFLQGFMTIHGDGKQIRDFVRLEDIVPCIIDAAITGEWGGIYNLSSGKGISINTLFKRFFRKSKPIYLPKKEEIRYSVLNNFRVNQEQHRHLLSI